MVGMFMAAAYSCAPRPPRTVDRSDREAACCTVGATSEFRTKPIITGCQVHSVVPRRFSACTVIVDLPV